MKKKRRKFWIRLKHFVSVFLNALGFGGVFFKTVKWNLTFFSQLQKNSCEQQEGLLEQMNAMKVKGDAKRNCNDKRKEKSLNKQENPFQLRTKVPSLSLCRWAERGEPPAHLSPFTCPWCLAGRLSKWRLFYSRGREWWCRTETGTYLALLHATNSRSPRHCSSPAVFAIECA